MSSVSNFVAASNVQAALEEGFMGLSGRVTSGAASTEFLLSALNTDGFLNANIAPGGGKERIVELYYQQRLLESEIYTSANPVCTGGDEPGDLSTTYNLDTTVGVSYPWTVELRDIEPGIIANDLWVANQVQRAMTGLAEKINTSVASKLVLNVGDFRDGSTSKNTKTKSGNANVFDLIEDVKYEMGELEYMGSPIVLGWGETKKYFEAINANCCADTGRDLREYAMQNDIVFIGDRKIETAAGSDNFIAMAPGAAQFVQFNQFDGPSGVNLVEDNTYTQGVLQDPNTGLVYDYIAKLDCGSWHFQLKTSFDVFFLPSDMYRVDDDLYGTNNILKFAISNS